MGQIQDKKFCNPFLETSIDKCLTNKDYFGIGLCTMIAIGNKTSKNITLKETHQTSGLFLVTCPLIIEAKNTVDCYHSKGRLSFRGSCGAMKFQIEDTDKSTFIICWNNPYAGSTATKVYVGNDSISTIFESFCLLDKSEVSEEKCNKFSAQSKIGNFNSCFLEIIFEEF